ncbi:MAG: nucleotide exchange factor GrpE [Firmicutes bacterium]|jgi:molecular chaperone GrpE|nr:nucleotide exchange factor GrpE [Bacillota bacterium]
MVKKKGAAEETTEEILEETEEVVEEVAKETVEEAVEGSNDTEKLAKECEELKDKYVRLTAEFQNFKRRTEKEKADLYKYANEKLIVDLLPVLDNFTRAIDSMKLEEGENSHAFDGVELIKKSLIETLEKNGLEEIASVGEKFDPEMHHAVMTGEAEGFEAEHVIEEFQKGYKLNSKVIRPSMVKVQG